MLRPSTRLVRKVRLGLVAAAVTACGSTLGVGCNSRDIQLNLVAGSLAYVKGSATNFWNAFIPTDQVFEGLFNPTPQR